jgi:hypothetical protein
MKIFGKIGLLLAAALNHAGDLVAQCVQPSLKAVNAIKAIVNNPALDLLTGLTKAEWDEKLLRQVRAGVDMMVQELSLPEVTTGSKKSVFEKQVGDLASFIREQPTALRSALYAKTAAVVAKHLSGNKLTEAEADTLVQMAYAQSKTATA